VGAGGGKDILWIETELTDVLNDGVIEFYGSLSVCVCLCICLCLHRLWSFLFLTESHRPHMRWGWEHSIVSMSSTPTCAILLLQTPLRLSPTTRRNWHLKYKVQFMLFWRPWDHSQPLATTKVGDKIALMDSTVIGRSFWIRSASCNDCSGRDTFSDHWPRSID